MIYVLKTAKIYKLKDRFDFIPGFELLGLAFSSKIQHTAAWLIQWSLKRRRDQRWWKSCKASCMRLCRQICLKELLHYIRGQRWWNAKHASTYICLNRHKMVINIYDDKHAYVFIQTNIHVSISNNNISHFELLMCIHKA